MRTKFLLVTRYSLLFTGYSLLFISLRSSLRETSQRPLRNSHKRCLLRDVRRLKNVSGDYLCFFKNTPQKWFCVRKVIKISDKIYVGPLETLTKLNFFREQCIDINQVSHEYQWADISVRVLASQRSSKPNIRCISDLVIFSDSFQLRNITYCHYELC